MAARSYTTTEAPAFIGENGAESEGNHAHWLTALDALQDGLDLVRALNGVVASANVSSSCAQAVVCCLHDPR
jgi:hypothetical protein